MARCPRRFVRLIFLITFLLVFIRPSFAIDARFDLVGPRINVRVTRHGVTLPIAEVPNLQPGDRLWLHPDLPASQSVHYLLICAFLRGTTNPPPDNWFTRIETWDKHVREEGVFVTVPKDAQQAVLFLAPETGGDFSTLKSAVKGRPGTFVRASQDLAEAGFEQSRIEKYLADIRRVPPGDPAQLLKHSDLLARTLALKPNETCFKQPVDTQFTCLTQTGSQTLLDDGHGQSIAAALSNGPNSDFIAAASYTSLGGGGLYSAYVGAVVDLVRIMANLHTASYQYIPAIAFPQNDAMNLRLNTPPSFHNPKSVLVIGLPAVQNSPRPPLRPADPHEVACLIKPTVTLPIEGAPLVFSTALAHDLVLHFNTPPGAPPEPDIPLIADAYQGGLVLQRHPEHHVPLHDVLRDEKSSATASAAAKDAKPVKPQPEPIRLTGTIEGQWGFDSFTGPTVPLQQLPGGDWQIASGDDNVDAPLIAGKSSQQLLISSTGSGCVHTITAQPRGAEHPLTIAFKPAPTPDHPNLLALTLPLEKEITPGDLHISIQQFGQPKTDELSARTFAEPAHIDSVELHAADRALLLTGLRLNEIERVKIGDLNFKPAPPAPGDTADAPETSTSLRLSLPSDAPAPPTKVGDKLTADVTLHDGRSLTVPLTVSAPRPSVTLLSKSAQVPGGSVIALSSADDLPLSAPLTFTLKTAQPFPRSGRVEVETLDGTLRAVLTLAPSGGLVLQDPHTVVATLDPLRSFGPSAFGALHVRAIFPVSKKHGPEPAPDSTAAVDESSSDWLPLGTLVRLPQLTNLQCPPDSTTACTLSGSSLYLIAAIAPTPAFDAPSQVPDGYTGTSLTVPHPASPGTLFLKLRDDPNPIDAANLPVPPPPAPVHPTTAHAHRERASSASHAAAESKSGDNKSGDNKSGDKTQSVTPQSATANTSAEPSTATSTTEPAAAPTADGHPPKDTIQTDTAPATSSSPK